jgi:hypothetical protein
MSAKGSLVFFPQNTQILEVTDLIDYQTGLPVIDASLLANLIDAKGNPVGGAINIPLVYIPETPSTYRGELCVSDVAKTGLGFTVVIDGTGPSGQRAHWELPAYVEPRKA